MKKNKKKIEGKNAFRSFLLECLLYSPVSLSVLLLQQPRLSSHFPTSFFGKKGLKSGKHNEYERKKERRKKETKRKRKSKEKWLSVGVSVWVCMRIYCSFCVGITVKERERKRASRESLTWGPDRIHWMSRGKTRRRLNLWTRWSIQGLFQRLLFLRQILWLHTPSASQSLSQFLSLSLSLLLSLSPSQIFLECEEEEARTRQREDCIEHRRKYSTQVIQRQFLSRDWEGPGKTWTPLLS